MSTTVVVGGTSGIGRAIAERQAALGREVVITGRDVDRCRGIADEIGAVASGFDLSEPASIAPALAGVDEVQHLVLAAIERDANPIRDYDHVRAQKLATLKLVGYAEVVHTLADRLGPSASILLFGGISLERPYPGSTTISSVNGAIVGLARSLAVELAPIRVNTLHPGVVGDSPAVSSGWTEEAIRAVAERTPIGRLVTVAEVADAAEFLLSNSAANGVDLVIDGGRRLT